uniref:SAM-dependent MTase RsmB/NOP-type domain-containing protein n=2 Tax=Scylla olivacea TaxID=85551 RepID=A0A0P4VYU9_SCYOL
MRDQGMIVTNSLSHHYLSGVGRLVSRCGLTSVLMTKLHLLDLPQSIQGRFSHVLLNAPCYNPTTTTTTATTGGGDGVMQASGVWFLQHVLAAAVDALVCGGVLVYLTLSARVEDNEQVIQQVRRTRQVEVVPLMLPPADYVDLRCEMSESGCLRITHLGSGGGGGGDYGGWLVIRGAHGLPVIQCMTSDGRCVGVNGEERREIITLYSFPLFCFCLPVGLVYNLY